MRDKERHQGTVTNQRSLRKWKTECNVGSWIKSWTKKDNSQKTGEIQIQSVVLINSIEPTLTLITVITVIRGRWVKGIRELTVLFL